MLKFLDDANNISNEELRRQILLLFYEDSELYQFLISELNAFIKCHNLYDNAVQYGLSEIVLIAKENMERARVKVDEKLLSYKK